MKGLINIQNKENEYFRLCFVRYLNPVNKNSAKIRNVDKEFAEQLHFKGVEFAVYEKFYAKMEKQNNIFINVFVYEDKTPYLIYTSKQTFEKDVELLKFKF